MVSEVIASVACKGLATDPSTLTPMSSIAGESPEGLPTSVTLPGTFVTGSLKVTCGKTETGTLCALGEGMLPMTVGAWLGVATVLPPPAATTRKLLLTVIGVVGFSGLTAVATMVYKPGVPAG